MASGSHAEGMTTEAKGSSSHTEGMYTVANGNCVHAEGQYNIGDMFLAYPDWAANTSYEVEDRVWYTDILLECTVANSDESFNSAHWKTVNMNSNFAHIVGNGTSNNARSNAYALDWDGNGHFMGDVYVGANADSSGGTKLVKDVQVNGTSVASGGVANIPLASSSNVGVVKTGGGYGLAMQGNYIRTEKAPDSIIKNGSDNTRPIVCSNQHLSVFYGLAKAAGNTDQATYTGSGYTEDAKSRISEMLSRPVSVSGTTPVITAKPGISYVCGEVSTLDITTPATGIVDIVFESGSTATVLTVTPPTGMTVKWPEWFDPTTLEANTTYELSVKDGVLAGVMYW